MISLKERKKLVSIIKQELNRDIILTEKQLCDWFIEKQDKHMQFCSELQIRELIQIAKEEGIKIKGYMEKLGAVEIKECCTKEELEKLLEDNSINAIAGIKGVDYKTIYKLMNSYNLKKPEKKKPSKKELEYLYNNYMLNEIVDKLNICKSKIYKLLNEYKINRKSKKIA